MKFNGIVISGRVQAGEGLGKKMGYPTANLPEELIKKNNIDSGLYAAWGRIENGPKVPAIVIVGVPYKFKRFGQKLEVYFIGLNENIRDKIISAELVNYLRPISEYKNVTALVTQIKDDIARAKKLLGLA